MSALTCCVVSLLVICIGLGEESEVDHYHDTGRYPVKMETNDKGSVTSRFEIDGLDYKLQGHHSSIVEVARESVDMLSKRFGLTDGSGKQNDDVSEDSKVGKVIGHRQRPDVRHVKKAHRHIRSLSNYLNKTTALVKGGDSGQCVVELIQKSINHFRHIVYYGENSYVYLRLHAAKGSNVNITGGKWILEENIWIWTFYGKEGSLEFLKWPEEFGIWSMGLLYNYVIREPMDLYLERKSGDCSKLEVGNKADDKVISDALKNLTIEMMAFDQEKYGPGFYCYKRRKMIVDESVYMLCKHMVCPIEAISHSCCTFIYNKTISERNVECKEQEFQYDVLWWIIPIVISIVLFLYSPILISYIALHLHMFQKKNGTVVVNQTGDLSNPLNSVNESDSHIQSMDTSEVILLSGYQHVTLTNTLLIPVQCMIDGCIGNKPSLIGLFFVRLVRVLIPFLSLSVIALQIILDNYYLHDLILESMRKGVPIGFRSMLGGYNESKKNFLPYLGGPFLAISLYIFITGLLLTIPESPIEIVTKRLKAETIENCPLLLGVKTIGILGSVRTTNRKAYSLLYHLLQAQLYMLLNYKFWLRCLVIQVERWCACSPHRLFLWFLPLYIVFCVVELVLATVFYVCPIVSFSYYIVAGYVTHLYKNSHRAIFVKLCTLFLAVVVLCGMVFSLLMFCTIFLDATLFVTRVFIFTFTGVIVYPKTAYGYLIFSLTVFYYLWDSISDFAALYQQLFKDTVQAATSVQRANDNDKLIHKIKGENGIQEELFEFVIEIHLPRRKQMFLSILKAAIVLTVLWMLIHLLLTTDNFKELHVIMHVGTALFICALPQIAKTICKGKENKKQHKRRRIELQDTIRVFKGYFIDDDETVCDSD